MMDLVIAVVGEVKSSNIEDFKKEIFAQIDEIKEYELETEQDFLDAAQIVNDLKYAEQAIENAREEALNQTTDVRDLFNAMTEIANKVHKTWYQLEKQIKADRKREKEEMIQRGFEEVQESLFVAITENDFVDMTMFPPNYKASIEMATHRKQKIHTIQAAIDKRVEQIKTEIVDRVAHLQKNHLLIQDQPKHLFYDLNAMIQKTSEEVTAIIEARVAKYELEMATAPAEDIKVGELNIQPDTSLVEKHEWSEEHAPMAESHDSEETPQERYDRIRKDNPARQPVSFPGNPIENLPNPAVELPEIPEIPEVKFTPPVQLESQMEKSDSFTLSFTITAELEAAKTIARAVDRAIRGYDEVGKIYFKRTR